MNFCVKGKAPEEIAQVLFIRRRNVYDHLTMARSAVGAHDNLEMLYKLYHEQNMSIEHFTLSPRGKEVFSLILKGYQDKEIGCLLGMSYSGVRRHKEKMLQANHCLSIQELVGRYYTQDQL